MKKKKKVKFQSCGLIELQNINTELINEWMRRLNPSRSFLIDIFTNWHFGFTHWALPGATRDSQKMFLTTKTAATLQRTRPAMTSLRRPTRTLASLCARSADFQWKFWTGLIEKIRSVAKKYLWYSHEKILTNEQTIFRDLIFCID